MPDADVNDPAEQAKYPSLFAQLLQRYTKGHTLFHPSLKGEGEIGDCGQIISGRWERWTNVMNRTNDWTEFVVDTDDISVENDANDLRPFQSSTKCSITFHGQVETEVLPAEAHPVEFNFRITQIAEDVAWLKFVGRAREQSNLKRPAISRLKNWVARNHKALFDRYPYNFLILTGTTKCAGWYGGIRHREKTSGALGGILNFGAAARASAGIAHAAANDSGFIVTRGPPQDAKRSFDHKTSQFTIVCNYIPMKWTERYIRYRFRSLRVPSVDPTTPNLGDATRQDGSAATGRPAPVAGEPTATAEGASSDPNSAATQESEALTFEGGNSGDSHVLFLLLERVDRESSDDVALVFGHSDLVTDYIESYHQEPYMEHVHYQVERIPLSDQWFALNVISLTAPPQPTSSDTDIQILTISSPASQSNADPGPDEVGSPGAPSSHLDSASERSHYFASNAVAWKSLNEDGPDIGSVVLSDKETPKPFTLVHGVATRTRGSPEDVIMQLIEPNEAGQAITVPLSNELRAAKTLNHRFILPYIGTCTFSRHQFILSPYMRLVRLDKYDIGQGWHHRVFKQIADALCYMHEDAGLIHCNIRPEHIYVTDRGDAVLTGFGNSQLADVSDADEPRDHAGALQTRYTAPEIWADNARATRGSDIWSFAMVMYSVFVPGGPWPGLGTIPALVQIQQGMRPPNPAEVTGTVREGFSDEYWALFQDCWQRDPSSRPTARQVFDRIPGTLD